MSNANENAKAGPLTIEEMRQIDMDYDTWRGRVIETFGPSHADLRAWDLYAAHALAGICAYGRASTCELGAAAAADFADALLRERIKRMVVVEEKLEKPQPEPEGGKA